MTEEHESEYPIFRHEGHHESALHLAILEEHICKLQGRIERIETAICELGDLARVKADMIRKALF